MDKWFTFQEHVGSLSQDRLEGAKQSRCSYPLHINQQHPYKSLTKDEWETTGYSYPALQKLIQERRGQKNNLLSSEF